jgi:flagellar biosynthesis protein FlhB
MAHNDKTEKATPKRRHESRKRGQVAKSPDFNTALVLIAGLMAMSWLGPTVANGAAGAMRATFAQIAHPNTITSGAGLNGLVQLVLKTMLTTVAPLAGICMATGIVANLGQVGLKPSFTPLKPDFKRINPVSGFKNVFGPRIGFETAKALAKVTVIGGVVAMTLIPQLTNLGASIGTPPAALAALISHNALSMAQRAAIVYLFIGLIDLAWQRRRHAKSLRMTKQEVKEEGKQAQTPPEVKAAMRRRQIQAARARMMAAVPQADVVVTNPTHFAVALSYDGNHPAPVVVAKGQDLVAAQIRRIAEENNVPVVPDPPLARSLHKHVELGQMIPADLYAAVAQVLAYVYRMAARRKVSA